MALTDNLVAYWKLDETSGTRYDSTDNNNDLTDNNTVGYATGKIGNCGSFVKANSEFLSITDANQTGLDFSTTFSFSFWVYLDSNPSSGVSQALLVKDATNQRSYEVYYANESGTYRFYIFLFHTLNASSYSYFSFNEQITPGQWNHCVLTVNTANSGLNKVYLYINNVDKGYADNGSGVSGNIANGTAPVEIGGRYSLANDLYFSGKLDEIGLWNRVITSAEISSLYNSGSGLTYPFSTSTGYVHSQAIIIN